MSDRPKLAIGPPNTPINGMNTTGRRQQINPNEFRMLRNLDLRGEAWTRIKGYVRLVAGALPAESLSLDGDAGTYVTIPYASESVNVAEYNLGHVFTVVVTYTIDDLTDDLMVISHSDDAAPPWRITHNTDDTITALVEDTAANQATLTTPADYASGDITAMLTRNGSTAQLRINNADVVEDTSTLSATADTKVSTEAMFLGSWSGRGSGSQMTYHEVRIHRSALTSTRWRRTKYPWSGKFGDPSLILHLTFEEGTGTTLTDYSRIANDGITITGAGSWLGTSSMQTIAPVTGTTVMENALGRKWILADIGKNHYRIPVPG